ncbi:MAG: PAS domain S-box protein [Candidatus Marinimicrobia bacterium]|nr:PAS domain S-box protein [Candidatus Neomarinimicrobiota bacterium]
MKENERKYKDLFLSSSEAIFILDGISLERVDVNNTALKLYGYNRAEFLSKFPVGIGDESVAISSKLKTGKIGDVLQIKNRNQYKKDGSSFLALVTVNFLDISNQKMIQVLIKDMADVWSLEPDLHNEIQIEREKVTDILKEKEKLLFEFVVHKNLLEDLNTEVEKRKITEHSLRISEDKYRSLVENSMIGIIIHIDGIVVFHNSAAKDIIGARETDKLIGQRVLDYVHPDYQDIAIKRMSDLHSKETADQGIIEEKFIKFNDDIIDVVVLAKAITFEEKTAVMVTFLDITKQKIIENKIKKQKEDLAFLSNCLIDAQETERKKIAQDLHDELGHSMTGIILNLDDLKSKIDPILTDQMRNILNDTINLVSTTDTQIHEMSLNLRPMMLEELGLVSTLSWYTRQFRERFGIDTKLKIDNIKERISPELDINIFRIVQESLTNIAKYANAQHAQVLLEKLDDNIHLSVIDDGNGFDVHSIRDYQNRKPGMGIMGMEERTNILNGSFEINSKPGKGCHLLFTFPCSKNKDLQ